MLKKVPPSELWAGTDRISAPQRAEAIKSVWAVHLTGVGDFALWPIWCRPVVQAIGIGLKPRQEVSKSFGVVGAATRMFHGDILPTPPPVKWIAQKSVLTAADGSLPARQLAAPASMYTGMYKSRRKRWCERTNPREQIASKQVLR